MTTETPLISVASLAGTACSTQVEVWCHQHNASQEPQRYLLGAQHLSLVQLVLLRSEADSTSTMSTINQQDTCCEYSLSRRYNMFSSGRKPTVSAWWAPVAAEMPLVSIALLVGTMHPTWVKNRWHQHTEHLQPRKYLLWVSSFSVIQRNIHVRTD